MSRLGKTEAIRRLNDAVSTARALQGPSYDLNSPEFKKWHRDTEIAVEYIFDDEKHTGEFYRVINSLNSGVRYAGLGDEHNSYVDGLNLAVALLASMIDEIGNYWSDDDHSKIASGESSRGDGDLQIDDKSGSKAVFLVHGRDESAKESVARFLQQIEVEVVILAEKANRGRTIIEKFEAHANVGFAVVLLTPDDRGSLQGERNDGAPRARQNVIFELGFFVAKLGRGRVCALTKGSAIEIPSDYSGVAYIPLDEGGGWQLALIKELKAAGLNVDANRAL